MKSPLSYLLTALRCEIAELERLARTSELVATIAAFVHELQRERGMSNIFLASAGERFSKLREDQVAACSTLQSTVLGAFEALGKEPVAMRNGARLFNRIAICVDSMQSLAPLRSQVGERTIDPADATAAFSRLIASLLSVVFEAADAAGDPEISRALVAMFHYMQGKEYAGQERAHGAIVFASARVDAAGREQWRHLVQQQHHCLEVFKEFADPAAAQRDSAGVDHRTLVQLERLRRLGWSSASALDAALVDEWYDCCTDRLDAMRIVEDLLAAHLRSLCEARIAQARAALHDQQATLERLHHEAATQRPDAPRVIGPQLERSVLDMVHEQSERLQQMSDELDTARAALHERKRVERAKGVLMAHRHLTEEEAYRALRQMAMNQKRRIADVAETVLAMADVLPGKSPH